MAKLRAILEAGRIVALGEHPDDISVPVPDGINFINFDRMMLLDEKNPQAIESWQLVEKTTEEKEVEAQQILDSAYSSIATIIGQPVDKALDFVKEDLVEKGKLDIGAETVESKTEHLKLK